MVDGIPVETTVYSCNDLRKFQKVFKVSNKYICGYHNGRRLQDKTFRVFASREKSDGFIGKVKIKKGAEVIEKFANSPEHCFIINGSVKDEVVPDHLDKKWYIELAKERLKQFGVI